MLHKRIIIETSHESTEFVSPIVIVKKLDGRARLILKKVNKFVKCEHFKMDSSIKTIINIVTRNFFMATIDMEDAYYSESISRLLQKFLKSKWKDKLYCFTCFPNGFGLPNCPRKFTKLNKLPIIIWEEYIHKTMRLFDKLGFVINSNTKN